MGYTEHSILSTLCVVVPKAFELNADNFKVAVQLKFPSFEQFAVGECLNVRVIEKWCLEMCKFHSLLLVKFGEHRPGGLACPSGLVFASKSQQLINRHDLPQPFSWRELNRVDRWHKLVRHRYGLVDVSIGVSL